MSEYNKYLNSKIYFLMDNINNSIIYVGWTYNTLKKRFWIHKRHWVINPNRKIYEYINKIGINNIWIVFFKNFPCNNREELEIEELKIAYELENKILIFDDYNINLFNSQRKRRKIINKKKYEPKIDEKNKCFICDHQFKNSWHFHEHLYSKKHQKNSIMKNI